MSDVTNPGLVSVADEAEGNPDPNGGTAQWRPRDVGELEAAADQGYPPAPVDAEIFPTPEEEVVTGVVPLLPVDFTLEPDASEVSVAAQSIGQGQMVPAEPGNPAAGYLFRSPDEFVVVGPAQSFQTNRAETDRVNVTVAAVLDADDLPNPADADTTRYFLVVGTPPLLTSYPVSILGRQVVFADDTLTVGDRGAARVITGYGGNYVVIDRDDPEPGNGDVPVMDLPAAGDVFAIYVGREASEDVSSTGPAAADVFVLPPPPDFVANPAQALSDQGDVFVSQVPVPTVTSSEAVPSALDSYPAEQSNLGPGLPANVFV